MARTKDGMSGSCGSFWKGHSIRDGHSQPGNPKAANEKKHPGFAAVQNKIAAKEGVSKEAAGAILAKATRGASAAAKKHNPRLKRVKG